MKKATIQKTKKECNLRLLVLIVLFSFVTLKSQTNPILNSDHIPILGFGWGSEGISGLDVYDMAKIKEMGLEGVMFTNLTQDRFDMFQNIQNEVKLFPYQTDSALTNGINYISYYCDAYYSKWQAVDVTNSDVKATLSFDTTIGMRTTETPNCIVTKPSANAGILIYGPGYRQRIKYEAIRPDSLIRYTTTFRLMIKQNTSFQNPPLSTEGLTDDLCRISIRVKQILYDTLKYEYYVVDSLDFQSDTIKVNELDFNVWKDFSLNFNYAGLDSIYKKSTNKILKMNDENVFADYVEYVVEWLDVPYARLYFDNVLVTDPRGQLLNENAQRDKIRNQANNLKPGGGIVFTESYTGFENTMIGFYGIDEPETIDQLEPVRIVGNLIKEATNNKRFLFTSVASSWDGKYGSSNFGTQTLNKVQEFYHRALPDGFIVQTHSFHWPYETDWVKNIEQTLYLNLKDLKNTSTTPFVLVQAGKWVEGECNLTVEPSPSQLDYTVNFALMFGAKGIVFDQLFYKNSNVTGIIKTDETLPVTSLLFNEIKNKLSFRLKNELGKTLRKLTPTNQYLNHTLSSSKNFIQSIIKGGCTAQGMQPNNEIYELGFFKDELDADYFMILSRWYNAECNPSLTIKIRPEYYSNYNLRVVDYINNQTFNTNRFGSISTAPTVGDAVFFGVFPVLKYGGSIIANDTTYNNETLLNDLTIENGATLTVNGTYNAKANITVKTGGKIVAGQNAVINFDSGKKLTVEGITEIKGTSTANKLTLQFIGIDKGIEIIPGSNFTLAYCNTSGSYQGIVTQTGAQSYVNISNSNITAGYVGITLAGTLQGEGFSTPPTSIIYKCNITSGSTGVSVSNYSAVLIKENTFTNCGISVLNVPSAYIQSNNISLGTNSNQSGIFVNSSGGFIRSNTIKNRVNGIHLANTILDIGGNLIENNYKHGLYIGSRSFPNLVGLIQTNPPTYYPLAGYNTIRNNGNNTRSGGENDGSEIYFSYSDAHLGTERNPGCNEISDDRIATPSMNTQWLLNGFYGNEPHFLDAIYNYWGTTTPSNNRFGIATYFSPFNGSPCSINGGGAVTKLVLKTSSGEFVDTISSAEGVPENFTTLEANYSEADNYFATGNVTQSKPLYELIVQGNYSAEEKLQAYNKLYTIGNLNGEEENYFTNLQSTFNDIANAEADTLIKKIYQQNAIKCDVSKEEYLTAISKFDNIIQQNPNSEEAVYAEIDIITTALNLDTTNSGLGKIAGGKYLVKGTSDYLTKLNNLLQNKFGINSEEKEQIIPKEYSLYQNYPNPFNPITTIKFDLPKDGLVTLDIYDILGRRITTLVNENRTAGSYEQTFDAISLASGVYVYKLQAGDFISSKKMLLLK